MFTMTFSTDFTASKFEPKSWFDCSMRRELSTSSSHPNITMALPCLTPLIRPIATQSITGQSATFCGSSAVLPNSIKHISIVEPIFRHLSGSIPTSDPMVSLRLVTTKETRQLPHGLEFLQSTLIATRLSPILVASTSQTTSPTSKYLRWRSSPRTMKLTLCGATAAPLTEPQNLPLPGLTMPENRIVR